MTALFFHSFAFVFLSLLGSPIHVEGGPIGSLVGAATSTAGAVTSVAGGAVTTVAGVAGGAVGTVAGVAGGAVDTAVGVAGGAVDTAVGAATTVAGAAGGAVNAVAGVFPENTTANVYSAIDGAVTTENLETGAAVSAFIFETGCTLGCSSCCTVASYMAEGDTGVVYDILNENSTAVFPAVDSVVTPENLDTINTVVQYMVHAGCHLGAEPLCRITAFMAGEDRGPIMDYGDDRRVLMDDHKTTALRKRLV